MWKPDPWHVPKDDDVQRPASVQINTHVPGDASGDDKNVLMEVSHEIMDNQSNALHQFVNRSRQQQSIAGWQYHQAQMIADQMRARWQFNSGQERVMIDVFPSAQSAGVEMTSDRNLDGYVVWVHAQPNYPHDVDYYKRLVKAGPWAVVMNGYVLEESVQPRDYFGNVNCMGYAVLFGKTALMCPSYVGDVEHKNTMLQQGYKAPFRLVPDSSGAVPSGVGCDGTAQPQIAEKFGYWIFDWMNDHNPWSFILRAYDRKGSRWNKPKDWNAIWGYDQYSHAMLGSPNIYGGIYFPDTRSGKSPLRPMGQNSIGTIPAAGADGGSYVPMIDCFVGEFYNRGKYTTLVQSWSIPAKAKRAIAATNKPLLFGSFNMQQGYSTGNGSNMMFDLSPQQTKKAPNPDNPSLMLPHDYFVFSGNDDPGFGPGDALTRAQYDQIDQWRRDVNNLLNPFYDKQAKDVTDAETQMKRMVDDGEYALAHFISTIVRQYHGDIFRYKGNETFQSFDKDWLVYATNWSDPGYLEHPQYPAWTTNHVTQSDSVFRYNLPTYAYLQGGVKLDGTDNWETAYDIAIPKDTTLIENMDSRKQTLGDVQFLYTDLTLTNQQAQHGGEGGPFIWDIFTAEIGVADYPWRADQDKYWIWGPGPPSSLYDLVEARMYVIMTEYHGYEKKRAEALARTPPTAPKFPDIGNGIGDFRFSKFINWQMERFGG